MHSRADDTVTRWATLILRVAHALAITVLIVMGVMAAMSAYVHISGEPFQISNMMSVSPSAPWYAELFHWLIAVGMIGAILLVIRQLQGIVATVADRDPFVPSNARRLRVIWMTIAGYELARFGLGALIGAGVAAFGGQTDRIISLGLSINLTAWFAVLVIFIIAEVFREGTRLREDQQLTI